jgi:hypothetical protein
MARQSWREWTFLLNGNTIYCSIIFVTRVESTKCINFLSRKLKVKTSLQRLSHISAKHANTEPTAWLQNPAKSRLHQTPP